MLTRLLMWETRIIILCEAHGGHGLDVGDLARVPDEERTGCHHWPVHAGRLLGGAVACSGRVRARLGSVVRRRSWPVPARCRAQRNPRPSWSSGDTVTAPCRVAAILGILLRAWAVAAAESERPGTTAGAGLLTAGVGAAYLLGALTARGSGVVRGLFAAVGASWMAATWLPALLLVPLPFLVAALLAFPYQPPPATSPLTRTREGTTSDDGSRPFAQVDVFSPTPCLGNPVAVVLDGEGLDEAAMRRVAHWTNLSETRFVLPPTSPDADYRLRMLTPGGELPFAGHPALGSAHAWLEHGGTPRDDWKVVQECAAGFVDVRIGDGIL